MTAPETQASPAGPTDAPVPVVRTRAGHVRHSLSLLRERGWAAGALFVVVLSVAFVWLGDWQFGRHETKVVRNERIDTNYFAPPVPLTSVLASPSTPLPPREQWRPVQVRGTYEPDRTVLVRNRPLRGVFGYEVIVPLRQADGSAVLVDRGWIPNGRTGAEPDSVPAPPTGTVTVVVRLRPGEPPLDRDPPPGQELRIDLARIAAGTGGPVYQAYGVLASEDPTPSEAPTLLPHPDEDLGPHLSYSFQWAVFALAAYVVFGYYLSKEARRRDGVEPAPLLASRPRRRRSGPTDEEWEDAANG